MYKAVIFDLDGTLLNTIDDLANACNHVLRALGLELHTAEQYCYMVGNGVPKLIERALPAALRGGSTEELALKMFLDYYKQHSADVTAPYKGIVPMLEALRKAGVKLGVVSNKEHTLTCEIIARYFGDAFDTVHGHVIGTPTKPDPHLVNSALAELEIAKADALYVGDSNVDVFTAKNAGVESCGVLWGFRTREELAQAGADYLTQDPGVLLGLILQGKM